jgi:hypothetical protein
MLAELGIHAGGGTREITRAVWVAFAKARTWLVARDGSVWRVYLSGARCLLTVRAGEVRVDKIIEPGASYEDAFILAVTELRAAYVRTNGLGTTS